MNQSKPVAEWFKNWFNEDYLTVYAHRTPAAARAEVEALAAWVALSGRRILDLGCGSGRHLEALASRSEFVCGADLSPELLEAAAKSAGCPLVRADLRALPFSDNAFTLLTCFFTGFGYLETDDEHRRLLCEWFRLLEPGGYLLLDCPNKTQLLKSLTSETSRLEGDSEISESRRFNGGRVEKEIRITRPGAEPRSYRESVRIYTEPELRELLRAAGFISIDAAANFRGAPFHDEAPRLILLAGKVS